MGGFGWSQVQDSRCRIQDPRFKMKAAAEVVFSPHHAYPFESGGLKKGEGDRCDDVFVGDPARGNNVLQ